MGETTDLFDPGFGVWEAAHTDPDGNLLRFGSPSKRPGVTPPDPGRLNGGNWAKCVKRSDLRPAAYLTANATSRSLATS